MATFRTGTAIDMSTIDLKSIISHALADKNFYPSSQTDVLGHYEFDVAKMRGIESAFGGNFDIAYDADGNVSSASGNLISVYYHNYIGIIQPNFLKTWSISFNYGNSIDFIDLLNKNNVLEYLMSGSDNVEGSARSDVLYGYDGNDTINSDSYYSKNPDIMYGGKGNDLYIIGNENDVAVERSGDGEDTVYAMVSFSLKGQYIENIELSRQVGIDYNINATGNKLDNKLTGNHGNNTLDGGRGADTMSGGQGDDTYFVDNVGDVVIESTYSNSWEDPAVQLQAGYDVVKSVISYTLPANVEALHLIGNTKINGTGNELANAISGNGKSNILNGMEGNDVLTGGAGGDRFVFSTALGAGNVDTITDFFAPQDSIRLDHTVFAGLTAGALIAPDQFKDIATGAADADDRILYDSSTGMLFFDQDGSGTDYDPIQFALIENKEILSYRDFLVI